MHSYENRGARHSATPRRRIITLLSAALRLDLVNFTVGSIVNPSPLPFSDCVFFELFQHRPLPAAQGSQHAPHPLRCHDAESDILHARGPFPALGLEVARLLLVIVSKHDLPAARPARERRRAFAAATGLSLGDEIFDDQVCSLASKTYLEVLLPKIVFVVDFPAQQTDSRISIARRRESSSTGRGAGETHEFCILAVSSILNILSRIMSLLPSARSALSALWNKIEPAAFFAGPDGVLDMDVFGKDVTLEIGPDCALENIACCSGAVDECAIKFAFCTATAPPNKVFGLLQLAAHVDGPTLSTTESARCGASSDEEMCAEAARLKLCRDVVRENPCAELAREKIPGTGIA